MGWGDFEGVKRTAWRVDMVRGAPACGRQAEESCQRDGSIITYRYLLSIVTYKGFRCCGNGGRVKTRTLQKNRSMRHPNLA
jgi:hypothetical protein